MRIVATILLGVAMINWGSCKPTKSATGSSGDKRTYTVWASPPEVVLVVTTPCDSLLEFYFNRDEWFGSAAGYASDSTSLGAYRTTIDSLEKQDGVVQFSKLAQITVNGLLDPAVITQKNFDNLLIAGHVWIKYNDGSYVANVRSYSVSDARGKIIYFQDDQSGRLLYYTGKR